MIARMRVGHVVLFVCISVPLVGKEQQTATPPAAPAPTGNATPESTQRFPGTADPQPNPQANQQAAPTPPVPPTAPEVSKLTPRERAWNLLYAGLEGVNANKRAVAVRVLSLLEGETRAMTLAAKALEDPKPAVRAAAALALGELHDKAAIPSLKKALSDDDTAVAIGSANALLKLDDRSGDQVFYAILTGDRKGGKGLIGSQMDQLKDPKQMAMLGFQEGIGFIPFAGIGYDAYRAVKKDDSSPVRAAAAKALSSDPDSVTEDALVQTAVTDKSELVRNAALDSLARRGNPALIERLVPALSDDKDSVKFTAAATIVHLGDVAERKLRSSQAPQKSKKKPSLKQPATKN